MSTAASIKKLDPKQKKFVEEHYLLTRDEYAKKVISERMKKWDKKRWYKMTFGGANTGYFGGYWGWKDIKNYLQSIPKNEKDKIAYIEQDKKILFNFEPHLSVVSYAKRSGMYDDAVTAGKIKKSEVDKIIESAAMTHLLCDGGVMMEDGATMKDGVGGIINQYEGKTPKQVWDEWDLLQRVHFLSDHNEHDVEMNEIGKMAQYEYDDLLGYFKHELESHVRTGQYGDGGSDIINQYLSGDENFPLKTPKEVWTAWDKSQRDHFIEDHKDRINLKYDRHNNQHLPELKYHELPSLLQNQLSLHIQSGQYGDGGSDAAAIAGKLAARHALRPEAVYNWMNKFDINPKSAKVLYNVKYNSQLLDDLVNDKFEATKKLGVKAFKASKGFAIKDQYAGHSPKQVWEAWDFDQRVHFLSDHIAAEQRKYMRKTFDTTITDEATKKYDDILDYIKTQLKHHIEGGQYGDGGSEIVNQYLSGDDNFPLKTPKEVWTVWNESQRDHFIEDHKDRINLKYDRHNNQHLTRVKYDELPSLLQNQLSFHIQSGQYADGGSGDVDYVEYRDALKRGGFGRLHFSTFQERSKLGFPPTFKFKLEKPEGHKEFYSEEGLKNEYGHLVMADGGSDELGVNKKGIVKRSESNPRKWVFTITWADLVNGEKVWRKYPNHVSEYFDSKKAAEEALAKQMVRSDELAKMAKETEAKEIHEKLSEIDLGRMDDGGADFNDWYRYGKDSQNSFFEFINGKYQKGDLRYARKLFAKLSNRQKQEFINFAKEKGYSEAAAALAERMDDGGSSFSRNKGYFIDDLEAGGHYVKQLDDYTIEVSGHIMRRINFLDSRYYIE